MNPRRAALLREIGLGPLWRLRDAPAAQAGEPPTGGEADAPAADAPASALAPPRAHSTSQSVHSTSQSAPQITSRSAPAGDDERAAAIAAMDWAALRDATAACRACRLCERRKQAVLGVGDLQPQVLFVGEGPGADEDERGEPFVGQAGKLLDAMLASIGLARGKGVHIANTVKCRPPENRTPQPDEMAACYPFLKRQIALLQPRLIVALGRPAAQVLLDAEVKIGAARGHEFDYAGIPLLVTYHPAYLLRNLPDKARAWEDLCHVRRLLAKRAG